MPEAPLIYFDNNATTRIDPRVLEAMLPFLGEEYGNPSSGCRLGKRAANAVRHARGQVAALLGCEPGEVVFTSGGTESDNAALASALRLNPRRRHLVTTAVEHHAILKPCEAFAAQGYEVAYVDVDGEGRLDMHEVAHKIKPDTALLSVMAANNETGVLFPLAELAELAREKGIFFHTDAVQAAGKIPLRASAMPVSYMSVSSHKIHGPKGVGALYVNRHTAWSPLLLGGGQEGGRRAGTENVPGIVGFGKAAELALASLETEAVEVAALRDAFERGARERIPGVRVNGGGAPRLPNTSNLAFDGVEAENALLLLERARVCASAGSACTAGSLQPSHVLRAMGCGRERAKASLRFSFSRFNTPAEVGQAVEILSGVIARLRREA
ncbi:MAG: aminotransferase class V-fold PLP-dependent enzyme [Chthoniobacteraceae bacterium]|nr:aminotransferase class V-fold PLP-dependent enzyme [Chthoniobacteraceae bacterium]